MNHRQRLETVLSGDRPDRVPIAIWRHFPVDDQNPESLAEATIAFQNTFDFDLVKVTPASSYCTKDWGAQDEWRGSNEGTRDYTVRVIDHPDDWANLTVLDPSKGCLRAQLDCLRRITTAFGPDVPVIQTIFSPLAQAKNLVGGAKLLVHLRQYPDQVKQGLMTIAETTRAFVQAAMQTGIAGIFYAVQHAQYQLLTPLEYQSFGSAYDLLVLEPAQDLWLNMLHLHGENVMFDLFANYPIGILNWHDQETPPDLAEGLRRFRGVVCGGLQRERTLVLGDPEQVQTEARKAFQATGATRFILGTGCVVPITAPRANLLAAREAVETFK